MTTESPISKWVRPTILGSVAFMCFGVAIITGIIEGFGFDGLKFGMAVMKIMAEIPDNLFSLFEMFFIVYGFGKSGERIVKHWRNSETKIDEQS